MLAKHFHLSPLCDRNISFPSNETNEKEKRDDTADWHVFPIQRSLVELSFVTFHKTVTISHRVLYKVNIVMPIDKNKKKQLHTRARAKREGGGREKGGEKERRRGERNRKIYRDIPIHYFFFFIFFSFPER